ncbi:MAG TPA: hypothetical protein VIM39_03930, partial [Candidatus Limnocylindrales bacterium]
DRIALFEVVSPNTTVAVTDRLQPVVNVPRVTLVGLAGLIATAALVLPLGAYRRAWRGWATRRREGS